MIKQFAENHVNSSGRSGCCGNAAVDLRTSRRFECIQPWVQHEHGHFRFHPFSIELKNGLSVAITFCTDFGQAVETESGRHAAPNPFELQKWNGKRWTTQLIGTDVGSGETAVSVDAHDSRNFKLQINESGRYRLRLSYLEGDANTVCPLAAQRSAAITSKPFSVPTKM